MNKRTTNDFTYHSTGWISKWFTPIPLMLYLIAAMWFLGTNCDLSWFGMGKQCVWERYVNEADEVQDTIKDTQ